MMKRLRPLLLAIAVLAVSCGSSEPDEAVSATAEPEATPAEEATAEPTAAPTAAPTPAPTQTPEPDPTPEPAEPEPTPAPGYDAPGDLELALPLEVGPEPGTLIDTEELDIAWGVGQRMLYYSTSVDADPSNPIAVSGFAVVPSGEPPAQGWPLIAWAHGTTGLGDSCAPSNAAESDALAKALVGFGYAVVATDYEGLGTPGTHPYVVGRSEGHGVLDSVRAAQNLELPVTDEFIVFGHSQGGHAAMFAGQRQAEYAPELNMIGVVAGAPPSQMATLGDSLVGGDFQGYLIMTAAGLAAAYDDLELSDVLSTEALDLIDVVETGCTGEIFDTFNELVYDEVTVVDDPFALDGWGEALAANDTNSEPVEVPLLIIHGGEDEQIPVDTSGTLFDQLCGFENQGPTVRNVYPGQSHAGVLQTGAAVPDLLRWVQGRFAGESAPDDCLAS